MAHWFLKHLVRPSLTDSSPCQQTQAPLSLDNYNVVPCDFRFSRFRIKTFPPHNVNKAKIHLHWRIIHHPFTCALTALSSEVNKFVSQYISFIDYLLKQAWLDSTELYIQCIRIFHDWITFQCVIVFLMPPVTWISSYIFKPNLME